MSQLGVAVNFFIALFALIDPIGTVPMFAAATVGVPRAAQRRVAVYISLFAAGFLAFFYVTGTGILQFFGISMPAFRIAGGLMRLIVPFGVPLLVGPGAISTVVIYASEADDWTNRLAGIAAIVAVSISVLAAFLLSGLIGKVLGKTGMMIVVRVLGLVLCAMAVQFIIVGLSGATVGLIRGSAVHPWQSR